MKLKFVLNFGFSASDLQFEGQAAVRWTSRTRTDLRTGLFVRYFKLYQVLLPFNREHLLFGVVAFLAAGGHIAFGGFAPTRHGNDMVHGQLLGGKWSLAVAADTFGQSALPPLGIA